LEPVEMIGQGFTRKVAARLSVEMGISANLTLIEELVETSEGIVLRESVIASKRATELSMRANRLQAIAIVIAILATMASVVVSAQGVSRPSIPNQAPAGSSHATPEPSIVAPTSQSPRKLPVSGPSPSH
jgi:hypothetical protein